MIESTELEALLERQCAQGRLARVDAQTLAEFVAGDGCAAVLLTADPGRVPESWDMAVVLPELIASFAGRLHGAAADPAASAEIASRFGVGRLPALLFLRQGRYLGALEGMYDWQALRPAAEALMAGVPARIPGVGVPVRAHGPACH